MPRAATGTTYQASGHWYARLTFDGKRESFALPTCEDEKAADARLLVLAKVASDLRAAVSRGTASLDYAKRTVERAASAPEGKDLARVQKMAEAFARGEKQEAPAAAATFRDVADRWISGDLARTYPDRVPALTRPEVPRGVLDTHVYPSGVGDIPIASFTLDHAEDVMRSIPATHAPATRRRIGKTMARVLSLAVFPLRLIPASPFPRAWLPRAGDTKAKGYLYPDEDRALLACADVPMERRLLFGFLDREGCRASEAMGFDVADVDLERGAVNLDENKTDDPRSWALGADVVRALRASIARREAAKGAPLAQSAPLFVDEDGERYTTANMALRFRADLRCAGVDRAELFETTDARRQIRLHDTRSTFVTLALASGRSETWVADRTGHKSSMQINGYRRQARKAEELRLGWLAPLDAAIPELGAPAAGGSASGSASDANGAPSAVRTDRRGNKAGSRIAAPAPMESRRASFV